MRQRDTKNAWRLLAVLLVVASTSSWAIDDVALTEADAARFLTQATFGPTGDAVDSLLGSSLSAWFIEQLDVPASHVTPVMSALRAQRPTDLEGPGPLLDHSAEIAFWRNTIAGPDQLRQRMAFALSQILVVSETGLSLPAYPEALGYYQDLLIDGAFGNYRDLLEAVTYSPAMATYLTYLGSEKQDVQSGRMPDENYARELLQLFTLGLVSLSPDGAVQTDSDGEPLTLFDNDDITELAAVFTGFSPGRVAFDRAASSPQDRRLAVYQQPLRIDRDQHESRALYVLGSVVPATLTPEQRVSLALDAIFEHPNVGPFIGRQLIQRFVTSNPSPAYVARVSAAFDVGEFQLPSGEWVGAARRGDLAATLAAILFDDDARSVLARTDGKVREPVLRFSHWARAFSVPVTPEYQPLLWDVGGAEALSQHPYNAPSVFNFFRPGYVAPGSISGDAGLVAPELQLVNTSSVPGYADFMASFVFRDPGNEASAELADRLREAGLTDANPAAVAESFVPDYSRELMLADDTAALIAHLDQKLAYGTLSVVQQQLILDVLARIRDLSPEVRTKVAVLMVMTSPDYLIQR